tara:strand:+ start:474 stop:689 length:216 start_codon:yes stop_codon:yes gene_type:complete
MKTYYAKDRAEAEKIALKLTEDNETQLQLNQMIDLMPHYVETEQGEKNSLGVAGKTNVIGQILFNTAKEPA